MKVWQEGLSHRERHWMDIRYDNNSKLQRLSFLLGGVIKKVIIILICDEIHSSHVSWVRLSSYIKKSSTLTYNYPYLHAYTYSKIKTGYN